MAEGICKNAVKEQNLHKGHRERLRRRFLNEGLSSFEAHNILELLLFYAVPQRDTNPLAHLLINRFGSVSGVLDADVEQLKEVEYIGENAAVLLSLVGEICHSYESTKAQKTIEKRYELHKTGAYMVKHFQNKQVEEVFFIFYDGEMNYVGERTLHYGSVSSASFSLRMLADAVCSHRAAYVIMAHNHPGGIPIASADDLNTTNEVREFLSKMRVQLVEHYIVAGDRFTTMEHLK